MKEKEIKDVTTEAKETPEGQTDALPVKEPRRKKKD